MNTKDFIAQIRQYITTDRLKEAIEQLQSVLENSPQLNEVLLQSARHSAILKQIRQGLVTLEEGDVTKNRIRSGLLDLLSEIGEQEVKLVIQQELAQAISIVKSKNVVIGNITTSGGNLSIGDTTHTESKASKRLRQFLFLFVPFLAIGGAYFWYQNQLTIGCCSAITDTAGQFSIEIPFQAQRKKQQLKLFKEGFQQRNYLENVARDIGIYLVRNKD